MSAAAHRLEFAPPPTPGMVRAFGLAIVAHILLVAALTWGVNWKRDAVTLTAEAELWSAVPQQAAPRLIEAPPAPPVEKPVPLPVPMPEVTAKTPDADIVTAREKRRLEEEKRADDKKRQDEKKKAEAKQAELKQAEQKQAALAAKQKETMAAQEAARKLEMQRQENMKRIAGLAGATGPETSTGKAQQSTGPSPSYPGRIRARVKPNIVFTDDIAGNPTADVEVRTSPDGTIVSRKLVKTSGVTSWDEAVLKAIDKTEVLPRDIDGKVPTPLVISFRPKD